ncbi:MAG: hypothetical protein J7M26_00670, partial [Armatimonadetes bacterium]|nr:hypothetical protein [Armatimonadota bacterium]
AIALCECLFHVSYRLAGTLVAFVALLTSIVLLFALGLRLGLRPPGAAAVCVAFSVTGPTLQCAPYVLSEPLFIALVLAAFFQLFADRQETPGRAAALGLILAGACLVRYIGVVLVLVLPLGFLFLRHLERPRPLQSYLPSLLLIAGPPLMVLAAMAGYNYVLWHKLGAYRPPSPFAFVENLLFAVSRLRIALVGAPGLAQELTSGLSLLALVGVPVLQAFGYQRGKLSAPKGQELRTGFLLVLTGYVVAYIAALCYLRSRWCFCRIDWRILWPAWPLLLLACGAVVAASYRRGHCAARATLIAGMIGLLGAWSLGMTQHYHAAAKEHRRIEAQKRLMALRGATAQTPLDKLVENRRIVWLGIGDPEMPGVADLAKALYAVSGVRLYRGFDWQDPTWQRFLQQQDLLVVPYWLFLDPKDRRDFVLPGPPTLVTERLAVFQLGPGGGEAQK